MAFDAINALGYEQLTVSSSAVGLTGVTGYKPTRVLIQNGSGSALNCRWRVGTNPTTTTGIIMQQYDKLDLTDPNGNYRQLIENIKFIAVTSDVTLEVIYFA